MCSYFSGVLLAKYWSCQSLTGELPVRKYLYGPSVQRELKFMREVGLRFRGAE